MSRPVLKATGVVFDRYCPHQSSFIEFRVLCTVLQFELFKSYVYCDLVKIEVDSALHLGSLSSHFCCTWNGIRLLSSDKFSYTNF